MQMIADDGVEFRANIDCLTSYQSNYHIQLMSIHLLKCCGVLMLIISASKSRLYDELKRSCILELNSIKPKLKKQNIRLNQNLLAGMNCIQRLDLFRHYKLSIFEFSFRFPHVFLST